MMRRCQAMVLALLLGGVVGCFTGQPKRTAACFATPATFLGPVGDDVVQMDVAVIERPLGERHINHDLWDQADEQANLECKTLLEANGFRVCQIGGLPPTELQEMLASPHSCPNPRRIRCRAGKETEVSIGPVCKRSHFVLKQADQEMAVNLEQTQCQLKIVPQATEDGRLRLRFTPQIRHGREGMMVRALNDPSGSRRWEWCAQQPKETYAWLSWQVTVDQNEYVIVGTYLDQPDTLGQECFLPAEESPRKQYLLVLRTAHFANTKPEALEESSQAVPLALQAAWTAAAPESAP